MYVCLCNALKEKEMLGAIKNGASCPAEVYQSLGCSPVCGKCVPFVEEELMPSAITDQNTK